MCNYSADLFGIIGMRCVRSVGA